MTRRAARASFPPCKFLQILINRRSVAKRFRSGCWFSHWGKRARFPEGWKENAIARVERDCEKNLDCEIFPFSSNSKDRTVFNTRLKKQFGIEKEEGAYWIYFTTERLVSFDTLSSRRLIALPKSSTYFAGGAIFVDPLPVKRQQNLPVLIIPTKSLLSFSPFSPDTKIEYEKRGKPRSTRLFFHEFFSTVQLEPRNDSRLGRPITQVSAHLLSGRVEDGRLVRGEGVSTTSSFSRLTRRQGGEGGMTVLFAKTRPFFFVCIPRVPCTWHNRHDTRVQRCHYSRTMGQAASTYVQRRRLGFEIPLLPRISRSRINSQLPPSFEISHFHSFARPSSILHDLEWRSSIFSF